MFVLFVLRPLLFSYRGGSTRALNSECKTDQTNFTEWMPFLRSSLMEEISSNKEALGTNN